MEEPISRRSLWYLTPMETNFRFSRLQKLVNLVSTQHSNDGRDRKQNSYNGFQCYSLFALYYTYSQISIKGLKNKNILKLNHLFLKTLKFSD